MTDNPDYNAGGADAAPENIWSQIAREISEERALAFLISLRPPPWLLVAIEPDTGKIVAITAKDENAARSFVSQHDGVRNVYYSLNPARTAMNKKPKKTDIGEIHFVQADLDPEPKEKSDDAKKRYMSVVR